MASLEQVLRQEINPFDPTTHKIFNFWDAPYQQIPIVESIHQSVVAKFEEILNQIAQDHVTRSVILAGDSGSGKSITLGRLRDQFNTKAFFVYISHWEENTYVWRHTLRCTVDSLLQVPSEQSESQLLLWLKSLPIFKERGIKKWIFGERGVFINAMKASFPVGMYNPSKFFGVLYDLTNPDLYPIAAGWLRGDDLDEEDLAKIKIQKSIDGETAARGIISNFGRISQSTYPIVLCFDNLDNVPQLSDGSLDLQPLFNINTTIHSQSLKNFFVIISLVTNNWKKALDHIQQADKASLYKQLVLRSINLEQAEALWAVRLAPLHQKANPKPQSSIAPLTRKLLEDTFPAGKANPRSVLQVGYREIERMRLLNLPSFKPDTLVEKRGEAAEETPSQKRETEGDRLIAAFKLLWQSELKQTQQNVSRFRQFSSLELGSFLRNALISLGVKVKPKLLPSSTYRDLSFSFIRPSQQTIGVIWTEEPNMSSFFNVMKSALKVEESQKCEVLYLIRAGNIGNSKNRGYQLCKQIFDQNLNHHLQPDIHSLCYLVTYDRLARSAKTGDLLLLDQEIKLEQLQAMVRETEILKGCTLLQELGAVSISGGSNGGDEGSGSNGDGTEEFDQELKQFILDFMTHNQLASQGTIVKHARSRFMGVAKKQILELIQQLCQENRFNIIDPSQPVLDQIVCRIPSSAATK
ncbi:KAP family P-loop domain-containing protein [filamentous cyanobacterium CCP2]|nr:KAP family P-loop domain-containing protein [filamentous cyanobacterium CCP2]